jgi:hypothetical protein
MELQRIRAAESIGSKEFGADVWILFETNHFVDFNKMLNQHP